MESNADLQPENQMPPSTSGAFLKREDDNNFSDSPQSKEEPEDGTEPSEECSVCRNEMIDTTALSDCVHEFCYDCIIGWLTKGTGPFCPMCKTPVKFIKRKGTDEEISLQQIQSEKEPEATASEDLATERRIVSRKIRSCRRLMNQIDDVIGSSSRLDPAKRQDRNEELNVMKQLCVSQLNSLQVLRDDINNGAAKALIVSRPEFRKLIYERQVQAMGLLESNRSVSRKEFLANIEHYRAVLNTFFSVELKSMPAKLQPKVGQSTWYFHSLHDVIDGNDEVYINKLFSMVSDRGVNELTAKDVDTALNGLVTFRVAALFLSELKSLVNSKKTFLDWCGAVLYRNRADRVGEGNTDAVSEIVTVDDSNDVEEEPAEERYDGLRPRRPIVYNPFDSVFGPPAHSTRNFTNYRRPSSSDTDQDEDIYFQAPLRLGPTSSNPFRPAPHPFFPPIPPNGISWSELTQINKNPDKSHRSKSDNVQVVDLEDEEDEQIEPEDPFEDVQVVDNDDTIVISDSPNIQKPQERKRKPDMPIYRISKKNRMDEQEEEDDDMPEGLVDDVQSLITKYNLPITQAMTMLHKATEKAIKGITQPVKDSSRNSKEPSTSSNLQPNDAMQLAGYLARRGLGPWSKQAPTKPTNGGRYY
ncbi:hypothetical protein B9Z55_006144 [Caenorhabditis nigoni]|uniref:RING-type domain-containing protein n=1 Tax=Caenorhabditis nigoni TaxID=1611254 RepID=A0A2G5V4K8_9PELO|nr:hypothetical protein B9Z55_006144 [Caenorhabditis nigoni]